MADTIYKNVEIDGEQYTVRKFTAIQGLQLVRFILAKLTPIIPLLDGTEELLSDEGAVVLMKVFGEITDEEVESLVKMCLKSCFKVLPAGNQAVMDNAGNFGVEGIEFDLLRTCKLCLEALKWGCADFFDEKGSALMSQAMAQLSSRLNPSTTMPSSLPQ